MASSSLDTHSTSSDAPECIEGVFRMVRHSDKLLRPRSLICYYKELSRLSRSNDPEEQLLQKIRDDASEDVLESYLDMTFQKISDGELAGASLDEQGNEGDKRRALARARVYDKALGEAKDGTPIEEFLVKKLSTDECLQRGGQCEKVDCSAVRWNMVNIVLALIRWREPEDERFFRKEQFLAVAVEYGHVELVQHLTKMNDVDVNISSADTSRMHCSLPERERNARLTDHYKYYRSGHLLPFLEPIGSAAKMGNAGMVMSLLACDRIDVIKGRPLHWAAAMGHLNVVEMLLQSEKQLSVNSPEWLPLLAREDPKAQQYGRHFSPLQFASLFGHTSVVKALCEDTKGRLIASTENKRGITALHIATEMKHYEIVKTLLERPEVAKQVEDLYRDRQAAVDAANAILVGAALIASVTFAGWLQPPLGYSAFFGSASIEVGAPSPSGIYPSFVSVAGHPIMQIFWFFNSMSFFFAIATVKVVATAARPPIHGIFIGEVVRTLRVDMSLAYILLTISVGCVMGAFASAGFLVLPPIPKYMLNMRVTVGIGVTVVFYPPIVLKVMKKIIGWIVDWIDDQI